MRQKADIKIIVSFAAITLVLSAGAIVSLYVNRQYFQLSKKLENVNLHMQQIQELGTEFEKMVSAYRGYAITRSKNFKNSFEVALSSLRKAEKSFSSNDFEEFSEKYDMMFSASHAIQAFGIEVLRTADLDGKGAAAALIASEKGEKLKNQALQTIFDLENIGRQQLRLLESEQQSLTVKANLINYALASFSFITLGAVFFVLHSELSKRKEAEKNLKDLNENLMDQVKHKTAEIKQVFNRITDAFIGLDKNWRFIYMNDKAGEMFKCHPKQMVGRHIWTEYPDLIQHPSYHHFNHSLETKEKSNFEAYYPSFDLWIENILHPSPEGLSVYFRDITQRKKAEQAEQEIQQQFKAIFDNTHDAILLADDSTRYIQANPSAGRLLGYTQDEILKLSADAIIVDSLPARTGKDLWNEFQKDGVQSGLINLKRKDGRVITCHYNASANILPGTHLSILRDISESLRKEMTLNRVTDSVISLDNEWRYTFINDAAVETHLHGKEKNVLGKTIWEVHSEIKGSAFEEILQKAIDTKAVQEREYFYPPMDKWFSAKIYPAQDGLTILYKDVTNIKKIEEEILRSKSKLQAILENTPDYIWSIDKSYRLIFCNEPFKKFVFKLTNREISEGNNIKDFIPESYQDDLIQLCDRALQGEQFSIERMRNYNNIETIVEYHFNPILNEAEEVTGISAFMRDITERKRAQQLIKESERRLIDAQAVAKVGSWETNLATLDVIWSQETYRIFDLDPKTIQLTHPVFLDYVHPDDQDKVDKAFRDSFNSNSINFVEHRIVTPKGITKWIEERWRVYRTEDGTPIRAAGTCQDVTKRKKAEEQMQAEKMLSESLINSLPGIFYLYDQKGRFIRWNNNFETISEYSAEEIKTMHPLDFYAQDEKNLVKQKIQNVFIKGMDEVDAHFLTKSGKKIPYYFNGWRITLDGAPCLIGVGLDISDRKRNEEAILKKTRELKERAKELNCLYSISELVNSREISNDAVIQACVDLISQSYQFPEITSVCITIDDKTFCSEKYKRTDWKQESEIIVKNKVFGKIEVFYTEERPPEQEGPFLKEERWMIDSIAKMISAATERKEAEDEIITSESKLRQLTAHLQAVREDERRGIAREIHDELGQQLTGLKMDASWINKKLETENEKIKARLKGMISLIDESVKTVRRISSQLRPGILEDFGLQAALEWQHQEFVKRYDIESYFSSSLPDMKLDMPTAIGIYRIYQESLNNISKHASATRVETVVKLVDDHILLTVADNGKGFNWEEARAKKTLGLVGMKERALMLGGQVEIEPTPGKGTRLIVKIPIMKEVVSSEAYDEDSHSR